MLLFGANDPFVDVKNPFNFLDSKRTSMKLVTAAAKVRHFARCRKKAVWLGWMSARHLLVAVFLSLLGGFHQASCQ